MKGMRGVSPPSPLQGKSVVITRQKSQAGQMMALLRQHGARPYLLPLIETRWADDLTMADQALERLKEFDALLFSSPNGVRYFFERAKQHPGRLEQLLSHGHKTAVFAVGDQTARLLVQHGIKEVELPRTYRQEGLVQLVEERLPAGSRLLYPRAKVVRPYLLAALREKGYHVEDVILYQTAYQLEGKSDFVHQLRHGAFDVVTLTSASTVQAFHQLLVKHHLSDQPLPVLLASIGPITTEEARRRGLQIDVEANRYTAEGLINAIVEYYTDEG